MPVEGTVASRSFDPTGRRPGSHEALGKSATAYEHLRHMAMHGELRPGRRLSPPDLAEYFAISVTPIRDALVRLAAEGFIVWEMSHGYFSKPFTVAEQRDLHDTAFVLVLAGIERAAEPPPAALLAEMVEFEFSKDDGPQALAQSVARLEAIYDGVAAQADNAFLRATVSIALARTHLTRLLDLQHRPTADRIETAIRRFAAAMLAGDRMEALACARAEMSALLERMPGLVDKANEHAKRARIP